MKRLTGRSLTSLDTTLIIHSKEIDIDGGYTIEEDMKILATALTDPSCTVERLQLHYFSLTVTEFTTALKSERCTLKTLHLYENKLTEEHAEELALALRENRSIETVILMKFQTCISTLIPRLNLSAKGPVKSRVAGPSPRDQYWLRRQL